MNPNDTTNLALVRNLRTPVRLGAYWSTPVTQTYTFTIAQPFIHRDFKAGTCYVNIYLSCTEHVPLLKPYIQRVDKGKGICCSSDKWHSLRNKWLFLNNKRLLSFNEKPVPEMVHKRDWHLCVLRFNMEKRFPHTDHDFGRRMISSGIFCDSLFLTEIVRYSVL